jgi:hypothetical protein
MTLDSWPGALFGVGACLIGSWAWDRAKGR